MTQHEVSVALHPNCDLEKERNNGVFMFYGVIMCFLEFPEYSLFWGKEEALVPNWEIILLQNWIIGLQINWKRSIYFDFAEFM